MTEDQQLLVATTAAEVDRTITIAELEDQLRDLAGKCADLPPNWIVDDRGDSVCDRDDVVHVLRQVFRPE